MGLLKNQSVRLFSNSTTQEDDILMQKLFLAHDPDGRWLDSETMLRVVGNIMFHACSQTEVVPNLHFTSIFKSDISEIELLGCPESVGCIIRKISCKMLCKCSGEGDLRSTMMGLFDLLGNYRWDAKVVLMVAAFAARCGEFWQLVRLNPSNALAASICRLRQLPRNLRPLKPQLKALNLLVKTMMDVAKCIIKFESLPLPDVVLSDEILHVTKLHIYKAVCWITRSTLACSSHVTDFTTKKHEYSDSTIMAAWELSSFTYRLRHICNILRGQVDACQKETERKLRDKLLSLTGPLDNQAGQLDNQEILRFLFPLKDYLPLKDCATQAKLGVPELKNKIVLLLISEPELIMTEEELLLLVQQTYDHHLNDMLEKSYQIVWFPIPSSSDVWTDAEDISFNYFSGSLPWYSLRKPWLLSSAVVKWIREKWNYNKEPIMVVLDSNGKVTNSNALDMLKIWGLGAPLFSALEEELWQQEKLTMQLMLDNIDPIFADWVREGKNICIYGSDNMAWVREFNSRIEELKLRGLQLETIYVGNSGLSENVKSMMGSMVSITRAKLFWLRLESMGRSILRHGKTVSSDYVLAELSALMNAGDEGWAVIGRGSSADIIRLQGRHVLELLDKYAEWGENVHKFGLVTALRYFLRSPFLAGPCNHSYISPSTEGVGPIEEPVVCEHCKGIMKKFVVLQ